MSHESNEVNVNAIDPVRRQELIEEAKWRAKKAIKQAIVLFVGPTGSGKSTTFNAVLGCPMETVEVDDDAELRYQVVAGQGVAATGNGIKSTTLFPQIVQSNNLVVVDSAGFGENRGEEERHTANIGLRETIKNADSIRGTVVFLEYATLRAQRREGLTKLISILSQLIKEPGKLTAEEKRGITFVVTKVPTNMNRLKLIRLLQNIKSELKLDTTDKAKKQLDLMDIMQENNMLMIRTDGSGYSPDSDELMNLEDNRAFLQGYLSKLPQVGLRPENFILARPESEVAREAEHYEARNNLNLLSGIEEKDLCEMIEYPTDTKQTAEQIKLQSAHKCIRDFQGQILLIARNRNKMLTGEVDVSLVQEKLAEIYKTFSEVFSKSLPIVNHETVSYLINTSRYLVQLQGSLSVLFKNDKIIQDIPNMIDEMARLKSILQYQLSVNCVEELRQQKEAAGKAVVHVHGFVTESQNKLKNLDTEKAGLTREDDATLERLTADRDARAATLRAIQAEVVPVVTATVPGVEPAVPPIPAVPEPRDPGPMPTRESVARALYAGDGKKYIWIERGGFNPILGLAVAIPDFARCFAFVEGLRGNNHILANPHLFSPQTVQQAKNQDHNNYWAPMDRDFSSWNAYRFNDEVNRKHHTDFGNWYNQGGALWHGDGKRMIGYYAEQRIYQEHRNAYDSWVANRDIYIRETTQRAGYDARLLEAQTALNNATAALQNHEAQASARLTAKNTEITAEKVVRTRVKHVQLLMIGVEKALEALLQSPHSVNATHLFNKIITSLEPHAADLPKDFCENLKVVLGNLVKHRANIKRLYSNDAVIKNESHDLVFEKEKSFVGQVSLVNDDLRSISLNYECEIDSFMDLCASLRYSNKLTSIDLSSAKIDNDKLNELFSSLRVLPELRVLDLRNNDLDEDGAMSLLGLIAEHPGICQIHLKGNEKISRNVLDMVQGVLLLKQRLKGEAKDVIKKTLVRYIDNYLQGNELLSLAKGDKRRFVVSEKDGLYQARHKTETENLSNQSNVQNVQKAQEEIKLNLELPVEKNQEAKVVSMNSQPITQERLQSAYQNFVGRTFWANATGFGDPGRACSSQNRSQSHGRNNDRHWYNHNEVYFALRHQVRTHYDLGVLTPIGAAQLNGETLCGNLHDCLVERERVQANPGYVAQDRFLIPLNLGGGENIRGGGEGGSHWVMLYLDVSDRQAPVVRYADPFGRPMGQNVRNAVINALSDEGFRQSFGQPFGQPRFENSNIPHQNDAVNCGPWIVEIGQYLADHNGQLPPANFVADIDVRRAGQQEILHNDREYQAVIHNRRPGV